MTPPYTTMPANGGERTVLLVGWEVQAVFIAGDHADLAARVAEILNQEAMREEEVEA